LHHEIINSLYKAGCGRTRIFPAVARSAALSSRSAQGVSLTWGSGGVTQLRMTGPFAVTREFPMEQAIFQVPDVICPASDVGSFAKQFRFGRIISITNFKTDFTKLGLILVSIYLILVSIIVQTAA
jgi:hypothetical protein